VIPDFREPDTIRLGAPPIYTRFTEVFDALDRLASLVARGAHKKFEGSKLRVT
jgi:kynureninase